ncbi:MAG: sigma-54 dependent transcriptional regulator [Desulfobaccales bacterium]
MISFVSFELEGVLLMEKNSGLDADTGCQAQENQLKTEEPDFAGCSEMIGACDAMLHVFDLIRKVAATDVPVLITGASGTGKEMAARAIHQRSMRSKGPFIAINCGAIPRELLESELFGYEKGAFTGAYRSSIGTVERAHKGTLFLDEVGELPLELQVKLLRFLQEYTFERVGGRKTIKVDLRVISATNGDLKELIAAGRFREDLYYRLDVVNLDLPHLKDRGDDMLIMAKYFLKYYTSKQNKNILGFSPEALTAIQMHPWPGNIRELVNRIRRAVVMTESAWITPENMSLKISEINPEPFIDGMGLREAKKRLEIEMVTAALSRYQWNVRLAARALKTSRSVIYNLMEKYKISPQDPQRPSELRDIYRSIISKFMVLFCLSQITVILSLMS